MSSTAKVRVQVNLPHPPPAGGGRSSSPCRAIKQSAQAGALLRQAQQAVESGESASSPRAVKIKEEFKRLATPPSDEVEFRPEERKPVTHWRPWCAEATEVVELYKNVGETAGKRVTDLLDEGLQIKLPDKKDDAKKMVALKAELGGFAEELAGLAYKEMAGMLKSKDYRAVRGMVRDHERVAEVNEKTRRQWTQLENWRDRLVEEAKAELNRLMDTEASVAVLEKRLMDESWLGMFAYDFRGDFEKVREEVQMREDTARYELQKIVAAKDATIYDLAAMIEKWSAAASVVKESNAVKKRMEADKAVARNVMVVATRGDEIVAIGAVLRQYGRSCGVHLAAEILELQARGEALRDDMWSKLEMVHEQNLDPDPMVTHLLIERSRDYGGDFDALRRKATKRLKGMLTAAETEIREMVMSTEYAKIVAVQRRHDGWPHAIDGALGMLENRRQWLLAEAGSALKRTRITTNIVVLHAALKTYSDYVTDCPSYTDVQTQHDKELGAAIAELRTTTSDRSATIGEIEDVLTRWDEVPGLEESHRVLAERLVKVSVPAEAELQRACGEQRLSDVDAVLTRYTELGGPALLASKPMLKLKQHRVGLVDATRRELKQGLNFEDALEIANLLVATEEYDVDLKEDRKALRLRRLKLAKRSVELMEKMQSSRDFAAVEKLLVRYEGCPPEATQAKTDLIKHRKHLVHKADQALTAAKAVSKNDEFCIKNKELCIKN